MPSKLKDISLADVPDDFKEIKKILIHLLNPGTDKIGRIQIFGWAEREKILAKGIPKNITCPMLDRLETDIYIAPDGRWYSCCLDSNNENVFGNINKESLNDIYFGEKRHNFIKLLTQRKYKEIGGPCRTPSACVRLK